MSEKQQGEFGKYKLVQKIGEEMLAEVFKAEEIETGRTALLKVLSSAVSTNPLFAKFFGDREAALGHHVEHPNILSIIDAGQIGKRCYVASEFVQGESLAHRLKGGRIETEEGLEILRQLAEALRAAHLKQVVHGDVKPANVILTRDRRNQLLVKLSFLDLALASADATISVFGEMLGAPKYMAPEQIKGRAPDPRSDQYSLGVTAYEMFAGHLPFDCERIVGYLYRNVNEDPIPLAQLGAGIPREISLIVEKLMAKDPSDRYKSIQRLIDDIEQAQMRILGQYVETEPPSPDSAFAPAAEKREEIERRPKARKSVVAVVALAVILLGAGVTAGVIYRDHLVKLAGEAIRKIVPKEEPKPQPPDHAAVQAQREKQASSLLAEGRALEMNRKLAEARRAYEKVIQSYADTDAARNAKAALAGLEEKPEPEKPSVDAEAASSETAQAYSNLVRQAKEKMDKGDFEQALTAYEEFAERHAGTSLGVKAKEQIPYVLYSWGERCMAKGTYEKALEVYRRLQKEFPQSEWVAKADRQIPEAAFRRGMELLEDRKYDEAAALFDSVLQTHRSTDWGKQATARLAETIYKSAKSDLAARNFDSCIAKLRELTIKFGDADHGNKAKDELPKILFDRGTALIQAKDFAKAQQGLEEITDRFPASPFAERAKQKLIEIRQAVCEQMFTEGRIQEALEAYDAFTEANPGLNWKPVTDEQIDLYRDMMKKYKDLADKSGEKVSLALAYYQWGLDLGKEGKVDEALEKHQLLIKEHPTSPWAEKAKLGMARLMYESACFIIRRNQTGDVALGKNILNDLIKKFPGDEWAQRGQTDLRYLLNCPQGMVYIPAADLIMGSTEEEIAMAVAGQDVYKKEDFADEAPRHVAQVRAFYIDIHEVSCADYLKFVEETKYDPPLDWLRGRPRRGKENHPVTMISFKDAEAYATWAGKRLPSEAEWELAARGADGRIFPWGAQYQDGTCNIMADENTATKPVGSYPAGASPFGCLDMIGNAAEWTAGWYAPYPGSKFKSPKFGETHRVVRGGSWLTKAPAGARCARREPLPGESKDAFEDYRAVGFRCAKTPE
ncbi:MAG: SUMF1/EgtB/PvdO family nonheme iron enzyme [Planctomycetota bacterium]